MTDRGRYYQNNTFLILTSEPWSIPELRLIVDVGNRELESKRVPVRLLAVRGPSPGVQEEKKLPGESMTPGDAEAMVREADDLDAPMVSFWSGLG